MTNSRGERAGALRVGDTGSERWWLSLRRALLGEADLPDTFAWIVRLARIAACLGVIAIIIVSLVPGELRPSIGIANAMEHVIAYLVVGALLMVSRRAHWRSILGLIVLAGVMELAQTSIPGRSCDVIDFVAGSSGALLGAMGCRLALTRLIRDSGTA